MPKVTIWIRKEDLDNWLAIKNRPEFIHNALNGVGDVYKATPREQVKQYPFNVALKPIKTPKMVTKDTGYGKVKVGVAGTWPGEPIKSPKDTEESKDD